MVTREKMTKAQKAIQTADDLDEQASVLNFFIANELVSKQDRDDALARQLALWREAARIRVDAITELVGTGAPSLDQVVAATDRAKAVSKSIDKVKQAIDLAASTVMFFATLAGGARCPKVSRRGIRFSQR